LIRAVLDANVLISSLISRKGAPGQILDAWLQGQFQICVSTAILNEMSRVLKYPRIAERLGPDDADRTMYYLSALAEWVDVKSELAVLTRDPSDNAYLACALGGGVDYLVTGNISHFAEAGETYHEVRIISPRSFLEILEKL